MSAPRLIEELVAAVQLAAGSGSVVLLVGKDARALEEARLPLLALLRVGGPFRVEDLGADARLGPRAWVKLTQERPADAFAVTAAPGSRIAVRSFGRRLNGEREHLRELGGPLLLLMTEEDERALREVAPDFFTWAAQIYALPPAAEMMAHARKTGAVIEATGNAALAGTSAAGTATVTAAPPPPPIRFLHLSDLHFKTGAAKGYDQDKVLRGLLERLRKDRSKSPLDLIFLTGDLAFSGEAKEYDAAVAFLRDLLDATGVAPDHLFVVPGNHDVQRRVGRWLLRTLRAQDSADFFVEADSRAAHEAKFAAYREKLRAFLGESRSLGLGVGADAVESVEVRGSKLAVASFNSAWFAIDDTDVEKLWLGEANLDYAARQIEAEGGVLAAVALMHHPTEYLSEEERSSIEKRLERSFDVVLRGHLHRDKAQSVLTPRGGYVELAAPAAYQGSQWPNGCFVGELHPSPRSLRVRAFKFGSGADPWVVDHAVFPDDEDGQHTFALRERRRGSAIVERLGAQSTALIFEALGRPTREGVLEATRPDVEHKRSAQSAVPAGDLEVRDLLAELEHSGGKLSPTLWNRLVSRLVQALPEATEVTATGEPAAFEALLERLARTWSTHGADWIAALGAQDIAYRLFAGAFFRSQTGQTVEGDVLVGSTRVDLIVHVGDAKAVIEVKPGGDALTNLVNAMTPLDAKLGAVLWIRPPAPDEEALRTRPGSSNAVPSTPPRVVALPHPHDGRHIWAVTL